MIEVRLNDDSQGSFEKAMKVFKKMVQNDGLLLELRDRKHFIKPSVVKRQRKLEAIRKQKIQNKKDK